MLLVSTGDVRGAQSLCVELLAVDELNSSAHYIMALCCEHAGDVSEAIEHCQAAAYLDPDFAMPHLQLGRLARRAGDLSTACRELRLALDLIAREDTARILLFGAGFGRDGLRQLCEGEYRASGGVS
jgi:chemotaxis protein methyltransferase CheR